MQLHNLLEKLETGSDDRRIVTKVGKLYEYQLCASVDGAYAVANQFIKRRRSFIGCSIVELKQFVKILKPHISHWMQ